MLLVSNSRFVVVAIQAVDWLVMKRKRYACVAGVFPFVVVRAKSICLEFYFGLFVGKHYSGGAGDRDLVCF